MKHRKHPLTHLQKVLMGKGALQRLKPAECSPWRGQETCKPGNFDPVQAEKNRLAGLWR